MPTIVLATCKYYPTGVNGGAQTATFRYITNTKSAVVKTAAHALRYKRPHIFMPPTAFSASMEAVTKYYVNAGNGAYARFSPAPYAPVTLSYPTTDAAKLENEVVTACLLDLKDMKVNFSQAFAEREQTSSLVLSSAKRLANAFETLKNIRRGKLPRKRNLRKQVIRRQNQAAFDQSAKFLGVSTKKLNKGSKTAANMWLELQYGWKPLLSDIYGSMVTLHENDLDEPERYRYTIKKRRQKAYRVRYGEGLGGIHEEGFYEGTLSCFVRLDYVKLNPPASAAASLGVLNPAELTWELLPYSFVVDWFLPVGDYLSTLDADTGFRYLGGSKTFRWETHQYGGKMVRENWSETGTKYPPQFWWGTGGTRDYKSVVRTPYSSSPVARFPGFKNPLTGMHAANALALIRGAFGGHKVK